MATKSTPPVEDSKTEDIKPDENAGTPPADAGTDAVTPAPAQESAQTGEEPEAGALLPVAIYRGRKVTTRIITSENWKALGINLPDTVWDRSNHHTVDIADFPKEAIEVLRKEDKMEVRGV